MDLTNFKILVGSLRYLTSTRPNISYGIGIISRFMETPHQFHIQNNKAYFKNYQRYANVFFHSYANSMDLLDVQIVIR